MALPDDLIAAIDAVASAERLLVASDFDGTLAPIVNDPTQARPLPHAAAALVALANLPSTDVALISGRALSILGEYSGMPPSVHLVGSHGAEFDTGGQERSDSGNDTGGQERSDSGNDTGGQERSDSGNDTGGQERSDSGNDTGGQERSDSGNDTGGQERSDSGNDTGGQERSDSGNVPGFGHHVDQALLARITAELDAIACGRPGVAVETKPASVALHVRNASAADGRAALEAAHAASAAWGAELTEGKSVVEFAVISTDKGEAVDILRERGDATAVVFFGDDVTDEKAFRRMRTGDVGVKVGPGQTLAGYRVESPDDVATTLEHLLGARSSRDT